MANLRSGIFGKAKQTSISDETLDQLFGMNEQEWQDFYQRNLVRHEMFSALALFAACEGGIRRDFEWRISGNIGQKHHQRFLKVREKSTRDHMDPRTPVWC